LKLIVTPRDDRTDFGEKDGTVTFQRILETQDLDIINHALSLADRAVDAEAELLKARLHKGRVLINDAPATALHAANERIFQAEEALDQIYAEAFVLLQVVKMHHAYVAATNFRFVIYTSPPS